VKAGQSHKARASRCTRELPEVLRREFVAATIDLLLEYPFGDITTRVVADRVGRGRSTIYEQFGSMEELFIAVCHGLIDRALASMSSAPKIASGARFDDDARHRAELDLRPRLVAWVLANGNNPERLRPTQDGVRRLADQNLANVGVSRRTADTFAAMVALLNDALAIIGLVYGLEESTIMDGIAMIAWMEGKLPELERNLAWGDSPTST